MSNDLQFPDVPTAVSNLLPDMVDGKDFIYQDNSDGKGATLRWFNNDVNEPSQSSIDEEIEKIKLKWDANAYARARIYPELGEQLDMLFHDMTSGKGDKTGEWYKAISKVKSDHPKP
tara:strand:- start:690 stop:1040 length:351 start_codon:yes stop_codon:yes gene_type:complete